MSEIFNKDTTVMVSNHIGPEGESVDRYMVLRQVADKIDW